jgi:hypothetical protein
LTDAADRMLDALSARVAEATAAVSDAVEEIRGQIGDLKHELARREAAPCSRDEAEQRLWQVIGTFARDMPGTLTPLLAGCPKVPMEPIWNAYAALSGKSALEVTAAFLPDQLHAAGMKQLDAAAEAMGGWSAMDAAARTAELRRLWAELLELERREEAVIVAAEASGVTVARRLDADPRAVLELAE